MERKNGHFSKEMSDERTISDVNNQTNYKNQTPQLNGSTTGLCAVKEYIFLYITN